MILYVSDHAIQRYRERIGTSMLLDDEALRAAIGKLIEPAAAIRARRLKINGVSFCLSYNGRRAAVTTVYEGERFFNRQRCPRSEISRREAKKRASRAKKG